MIRHWSAAIAQSWLSAQVQDHVWVVPAFQSLHIVAIGALLFASGSTGMAVLRAPAAATGLPWLTSSYRWTWTALAVLLISGAVLITGEPTRSLMNVFFRIKLVLVLIAAGATLLLQRQLTAGRRTTPAALLAGLAGVAFAAWVAIIFCGRFIAYFGDLAG